MEGTEDTVANNKVSMKANERPNKIEKRSLQRKEDNASINVHVNAKVIEANSLTHVNGFVKGCKEGKYEMPNKVLRNGLFIAESFVNIIKGDGNGVSCCPILVLNPTDEDIPLRENEMLGSLKVRNDNDIEAEVFVTTLRDCVYGRGQNIVNIQQGTGDGKLMPSSSSCLCLTISCEKCGVKYEVTETTTTKHVCTPENVDVKICADQSKKTSYDAESANTETMKQSRRPLVTADVNCDNKYQTAVTDLLNSYRDVATLKDEPIGVTSILKHRITLKPDSKVINIPPNKIPHKYKVELEKVNTKWFNDTIIEDSMSDFNFPVIVVRKKSGEIRPVIDFRALNKIVNIESYPIPRVDEILATLGGCEIFSSLDLKSAFLQVELTEDSRKYTAFSVNYRKYQFRRLPFGYTNSPAVFQAVMSKALHKCLGRLAFVFIDDILIFSKNINDHLEDIREILEDLRSSQLTVKLEKCSFFKTEIEYLGHLINKEGIKHVQNDKLKNMNRPKNVSELQRFLGLANYFRKFIPIFSIIASPLYKLLRKNEPFNWTDECEDSFNKLKNSLTSETVLAHPNYNAKFYLFCDASDYGCGACLMQAEKSNMKNLRPIAYFSKAFNNAQKSYNTTKKELASIYLAVREFKYLILGYPIVILTDHLPLKAYFDDRRKNSNSNLKIPTDVTMARWVIEINSYDCTALYFPGKKNIVADTLSRIKNNPVSEEQISQCQPLSSVSQECCVVTTRSAGAARGAGNTCELDHDSGLEHNNNRECTENVRCIPLVDYIPKLEDISWSIETLKTEQEADPFCSEIKESLKSKLVSNVKDLQNYLLLDNILYKKRSIDGNQGLLINVVIPSTLINKAINSIHYNTHCDLTHTLFKFKLKFYHPHERSIIKKFVEACDVCKILKGRSDIPIKIREAPIAYRPFQTVSFDFVGKLKTTDSNNKYILTIVDMFSRFCVLHAVPDKSTTTVIDCLENSFNKFGYPETLLSDNALEFCSEAMMTFAKLNQIYKTEILPYAPFANGICERNNAKINKLLRLYVNSTYHCNWDYFLSTVENTINNQVVSTIKETPSFTLFGYDTSPNVIRTNLEDKLYADNPENLVKYRARQCALIQEQIRHNIITNTTKRNQYHNLKRKDKNLKIGDRVLIKNHTKKSKLDLNWIGPGSVTNLDNNKCSVSVGNTTFKTHVNHVLRLKDIV